MNATFARRILLIAAATAAIACSGDSATGPSATVSGTYSLSTVNGKALPFVVTDTVDGQVFTSTVLAPFTLALNSDKSMRMIGTFRVVIAGQTQTFTDTATGTYTVSGNAVTLNSSEGDVLSGTWNGSDMLTISDPPDVLVFRKQ
jgi:hypothetical protein